MRKLTSLNGTWKLVFDEQNEGRDARWFDDAPTLAARGTDCPVPSIWELLRPDYDGVGWYTRTFDYAPQAGRHCRIRFDAVNYRADVWLNGHHLGQHDGGYTPFELAASPALRSGENVLVVRVLDVAGKAIDGLTLAQTPSGKEGAMGNFGGIWQDVTLIESTPAYLVHCHILPKPSEQAVALRLRLHSPHEQTATLRVRNTARNGQEAFAHERALVLKAGENLVEWEIAWSDFQWWSPETPHLYDLGLSLHTAEGMDALCESFGMREFTVKHQRFYLNGRDCHVKGLLHQAMYPITLAYPESEEFARREIALCKEAGASLLRLHIKTFHPITLRLADEMGLLLYCEPPIGWIDPNSPDLQSLCERELREMIERDFNHPAIVIWGVLNETGNPGFSKTGGCQAIRDDLARYTRSLDPTRIVVDDSGSYEFTGRSHLLLPYSDTLIPTQDRHGYYKSPLSKKDYDRVKSMGDPQMMLFRSEYGTGGLPDVPALVREYQERCGPLMTNDRAIYETFHQRLQEGFTKHGLQRIFSDLSDFCLRSQEVQADGVLQETQAMRLNPNLAGYIICQFSDYPRETGGGILDIFLHKKKAFETMRLVNRPLQATLMADPVCYYPGTPLHYEVALVNEHEDLPDCELHISLLDTQGKTIITHRSTRTIRHDVEPITAPEILPPQAGKYTLESRIARQGESLAVTQMPIAVYPRPTFDTQHPVHVIDPTGRLGRFLASQGVPVIEFNGTQETSLILTGELEELSPDTYERLLAACALAERGALVAFLGIGNQKSMSPWNKEVTFDFFPDYFPEKVHLVCGEGRVDNTFHYLADHPLFAGLPVNTIINQEYRRVFPNNAFVRFNPKAEVLAGCFHMLNGAWGVDVALVSRGKGQLLFDQFNIIPNLGEDPVADTMLANLLTYSRQYTLSPEKESQTARNTRMAQAATFRQYIENDAREWLILGPFANPGNYEGMHQVQEPEYLVAPDKSYQGAHGPISWKRTTAVRSENYIIDLARIFPRENSLCYALTYFKSTVHKLATLRIRSRNIEVWFNNDSLCKDLAYREERDHDICIDIRRGWNKILIKSADYCFDGTINNTVSMHLFNQQGEPFPDLLFSLGSLEEAEKEIRELNLPPYLR